MQVNVCVWVGVLAREGVSERISLHDGKILIYLNEPVWIMIGVFSHFFFSYIENEQRAGRLRATGIMA